jgi:hypothetical protein
VSRTARRGVKLWDWLLWTALGIGLFEPWLANRISSRHYGRASDLSAALNRNPHGARRADAASLTTT